MKSTSVPYCLPQTPERQHGEAGGGRTIQNLRGCQEDGILRFGKSRQLKHDLLLPLQEAL